MSAGERWALIDRVVDEIYAVRWMGHPSRSMAVGKLVIDSCFGGDLAAWCSRGFRDASYRELAVHPAITLSARGLHSCVAHHVEQVGQKRC
jgi:hypothetical protein